MCDPSPQVCNLGRVVTQHTSTAVDSIPDPSVDSVRISAALTSFSEVSFLISLTLPGLSDPVSALIDLGATSNFLDSSLAASPPFVLEPLDFPIALCLFDGKPATAGFIHESVNTSISVADHSTRSLSLLMTKLHPSTPIVLGLPWLQSTNLTVDWSALSLTFKTGPQSALPLLALARACSTAALHHKDIISDLSPAFNSIPELCTCSGPSVPIAKMTSSVKLGPFSSNSAPPLGSIPWNRPGFVPPELMHSWDPLSPWFSMSDKFSPTVGGVPTPATIFPLLREDHVNNHLSLGVPPPNMDTRTPCQVEVIPHKSEGIEPFNLVNSPPGQVKDASSHPINSPSGPVEDASSHTVNFPPCQVRALPSHPINSPSGSLGVSSPVSCTVPASVSDRVTPVLSLSPPVPVPNPIAPRPSSVTSPSCFTSSGTASVPLNTTQATSHEQPMALPVGSDCLRSAFIEEVDDEDLYVPSSGSPPIGHTILQHVDDPDVIDSPGPTQPRVPLPTDNPDEGLGAPDSSDNSLPFLGDPEPEFFGEMTPPSISLIGAAAFKWLIDAGKEVYTINIQLTSNYLDIVALRAVGSQPAPTSALHTEPLPTDEAELFAKVVPEAYQDFFDVFSREEANNMPPHREFDHEIHIENDQTPPHSHIYPLSGTELSLLREFLDDMLSKGFIRSLQSPGGAPVLFAKKKHGTLRLCVDFRNLNKITRKDQYPIPLVTNLLNQLGSTKVYTKLDLHAGYYNVRVAAGHKWKMAFQTHYGSFEFLVMLMGLTNSPATFQAFMNHIFRDMTDIFIVIYLDDILIFSDSLEDHRVYVRCVLECLCEYNLHSKPEKCLFHMQKIKFLGFMVTPTGISMGMAKTDAVSIWPTPTNLKAVQCHECCSGFP